MNGYQHLSLDERRDIYRLVDGLCGRLWTRCGAIHRRFIADRLRVTCGRHQGNRDAVCHLAVARRSRRQRYATLVSHAVSILLWSIRSAHDRRKLRIAADSDIGKAIF